MNDPASTNLNPMRFGIFIGEARSEFINLIRENIPKLFWELILICKTNPNIFFLQVPFLGPNAWGRGVVR
jgi:hypothetical protein